MKESKRLSIIFLLLFVILAGLSITTCLRVIAKEQEVVLEKVTVIYDENAGVLVDGGNVTFNDKNQTVDLKAVITNTQNYDVKIKDIKLSTPSEEFLIYDVKTLDSDILKANSDKEILFSLETSGVKGWGRNFSDKLTANISFAKVETNADDESIKVPEKPALNTEELLDKVSKLDVIKVTSDTIEFKESVNVVKGDKIAVWIYSDPVFLGYFEVDEIDGVKRIIGLEAALKKLDVVQGEHTLALVSNDGINLGYVGVYVDEQKSLYEEKPLESNTSNNLTEEDLYVENPNTSDKSLLMVLILATGVSGLCVVFVSRNKVSRYAVFTIFTLFSLTLVNADELLYLTINFDVSFKSQNVMKMAYIEDEDGNLFFHNFWRQGARIKNFIIKNEIVEIPEYVYSFDVTDDDSGRVMAYLVDNVENETCLLEDGTTVACYDLYLIADGMIYPNKNAGSLFEDMHNLDKIENIEGLVTSEVTSMAGMFNRTGENSSVFTVDLSSFDTSNVTNFWAMFFKTAYNNENFTLDVSSFDTSKATDMANMFSHTGYNSSKFSLDLSHFDTSNVTDMSQMFWYSGYNSPVFDIKFGRGFNTGKVTSMANMFAHTGYNSKVFTLDLSSFDTSNVTNMAQMFWNAGYSSPVFTLNLGKNFKTHNVTNMANLFNNTGYKSKVLTLDVSNFDTSKVADMVNLFNNTGRNSATFTLDVSNFDTGNVTNMKNMFYYAGYSNPNFTLDVSNFDTSKVTNMSYMFGYAGYNSSEFVLDLSNFDTSNVTNMAYMFTYTGHECPKLTIDLSGWDSKNVTDMSYMFFRTGYSSSELKLDLADLDTPNVINMRSMFNQTGYSDVNFNMDVSGFDTGKVTEMTYMFFKTGYNSSKFKTSITISNPNVANYTDMFVGTATLSGAQVKVNYTQRTSELVDKMILKKSANSNVIKGEYILDTDNLAIGDEIRINGEKFNIVSLNDNTVTMLAKYNLGSNYKQSTSAHYVLFSSDPGWVYSPGPKEIDIQTWSSNIKKYVNEYVDYLSNELNDDSVTGDLMSLKELESLGCAIPSNYAWIDPASKRSCASSQYLSWISNGQTWWTKSSRSEKYAVWRIETNGDIGARIPNTLVTGVRPVVTVSRDSLIKLYS